MRGEEGDGSHFKHLTYNRLFNKPTATRLQHRPTQVRRTRTAAERMTSQFACDERIARTEVPHNSQVWITHKDQKRHQQLFHIILLKILTQTFSPDYS